MINVIKKISIIVVLMLVIAIVFSGNSQATIGNIFKDAEEFLEKGDLVGETINETQLQETSKFLYKLLLAIGIVVMFIVGTILGIQFMVASAEDKAKVKEALVPYIVGCFVIFGAFTIWSTVVNIGQDMIYGSSSSEEEITLPYTVQTGTWYWCMGCDRELTEGEIRNQECSKIRSHKVDIRTERYYCSRCGDEWDEGERRQQDCDECRQ